ncbi:hypothetical protein ABK040_006789 [Willaertia magna]
MGTKTTREHSETSCCLLGPLFFDLINKDILLYQIFPFLDIKSIINFFSINKQLCEFSQDDSFWESYFEYYCVSPFNDTKIRNICLELLGSDKEIKNYNRINKPENYWNEEMTSKILNKEMTWKERTIEMSRFRFNSTKYPKPQQFKDENNWETHNSRVLFTNNNRTIENDQRILKGWWETIIAHKKLTCGNVYYWAIYLDKFSKQITSNMWMLLIGVDFLTNLTRNERNDDVHYTIGNSKNFIENSSKQYGFGYCVRTDSPLRNGQTSYTEVDINTQNDVIGLKFEWKENSFPEIVIYRRDGGIVKVISDHRPPNDTVFYPAVSLVNQQSVTILPWNGDLNRLFNANEIMRQF